MSGLPEVIVTVDPESPENPGFKFGSFGKLVTAGFECYVLQRAPTGDHPYIGFDSWRVAVKDHPVHGKCYEVLAVNGRTAILFHPANWYQELLGCLALGRSIAQVIDDKGKWLGKPGAKQLGITSSHDAVAAFMAHLEGKDFMLTIKAAA